MPKIKSRYNHVKIWRPRGSLYADGRDPILNVAMVKAKNAFSDEFARAPAQELTVFECVGTSSDWVATLIEVASWD